MHTIASPAQAARTLAIAVHAAQHAQATADRTAPHWKWVTDAVGVEELWRIYPQQGIPVRQDDVTLFVRGGQ